MLDGNAIVRVIRRHDRLLASMYLLALLLGVAILLVPPARRAMGSAFERATDYWDNRWVRRVLYAEALLAEGQTRDAADVLDDLVARFPVRDRVHAKAWVRIRLLRLSGQAHMELGRKRRSLDALRSLVEFDPRDYSNHVLLGATARALGETEIALSAYQEAFALNPAHLPTLAALVHIPYEAGEFNQVVLAYRAFLDARHPIRLAVHVGQDSTGVVIDEDGVLPLEARFSRVVDPGGAVFLRFADAAVVVDSVRLHRPFVVGTTRTPGTTKVTATAAVAGPGTIRLGRAFVPEADSTAWVALPLPNQRAPVSGVSIWATTRRVVPAEVWGMVARSHLNTLQLDALAAAERRTVVWGEEAS